MAGEIDWVSWGSNAFTRSMTSMMLAPGWRRMIMRTARLPSTQPAIRVFSTLSTTAPMSCRRTGDPFRYATTRGR